MTVHKATARLLAVDGEVIGEGRAYLHLRVSEALPQEVQGTLSLDWWSPEWSGPDAQLELSDGPTLVLRLQSDKISACIDGRVLRYRATWPGTATT
jgi:hypothetical protein